MKTYDDEFDLIAVGSGIGGLSAAITASEYGLRAAVLEKSKLVGGVTALSGGQVWVAGNDLEAQAGIEDSPAAGFAYLKWVGAGRSNESLLRVHCENAPIVARFFAERAGVRWRIWRGQPDYYYPVADESRAEGRTLEVEGFSAQTLGEWQSLTRVPFNVFRSTLEERNATRLAPEPDTISAQEAAREARDERFAGAGLACYFTKGALDRQIPLLTDTCARELICEGGRVVGVEVTSRGQPLRFRATRAVVLATSGYDWDPRFMEYLGTKPEIVSAAPRSVAGDHLRMAGMLGAQVAVKAGVTPIVVGYRLPGGEDDEGNARWAVAAYGLPHMILVNRHGRRFSDETFLASIETGIHQYDGRTGTYINHPFWAVFDSSYRERYMAKLFPLGHDLPSSVFASGRTLEELAETSGIEVSGLKDEVAKFNAYSESGVDLDFHRGEWPIGRFRCADPAVATPNPTLAAIKKSPFYAVRLSNLGNGIGSAGLVADENARVIDYRGDPIQALYAAGNSMAMLDLGAGYQSGNANTRGMVFGYLAALHAAGRSDADSQPAYVVPSGADREVRAR